MILIKNYNKNLIYIALITMSILFVACSLQTTFAANNTINGTSTGGIGTGITNTGAGDTLFLQSGTYNKTNQDTNKTISKSITIQGNGSTDSVIIDAQKQSRIFSSGVQGINIIFINITFINANATGNGGAFFNSQDNTNIKFINCTFINNTATSGGGAIYNQYGVSFLVDNCTFIDNSAASNGGAIVDNAQPRTRYGNFTVVNSTFISNSAASNGGAIYSNNMFANLTDNTFIDNNASIGGGIYNNGNMSVSGNTMTGNSATIRGNVIYNAGRMGILNLTYLNNSTQDVTIGQNVSLFATLTDDMGNLITGQNISFYVNGILIRNVTAIEGYANLTYTASGPSGIVPVNGTYIGSGAYPINIANGQLRINKLNASSTIVAPEKVLVGKTINITGVATDENGNPLANTELNVTVDGVTYTVTTDSNGNWVLPYTPTHTGNVDVSVSWAGNSTHNGFTNSTNFDVEKRNIIVTLTVDENNDGSVTITANATYEDDGSPAVDYPVEFYLDGNLVGDGSTDNNGIASLTIPANKITDGPHTITVIVIGGDTANDGTASIEFTKISQDNETNETNNTNETIKNPVTSADMKETGIPIIAVILVLLASISFIIRKKE